MDDAKRSKILQRHADVHAAFDRALGAEHECSVTRQLREAAHQAGARADRGPAQVATDTYRANYDTIFGSTVVGEA